MKRWLWLSFLALVLSFLLAPLLSAVTAFAQAAGGTVNTDPPSLQEWWQLYQSLGQAKGAGVMAIVVVVIQALLLLARSSFDPLPGPVKLLVVTGLTLVLSVIGLKMTTGMDWVAALMHSSTLAALQVFANQVYQQIAHGGNPPKAVG